MQCKTVEELMALGKAEGIVLTEDEAEAFLAELSGYELEGGEIKKIAVGIHRINRTDCMYYRRILK